MKKTIALVCIFLGFFLCMQRRTKSQAFRFSFGSWVDNGRGREKVPRPQSNSPRESWHVFDSSGYAPAGDFTEGNGAVRCTVSMGFWSGVKSRTPSKTQPGSQAAQDGFVTYGVVTDIGCGSARGELILRYPLTTIHRLLPSGPSASTPAPSSWSASALKSTCL